MDNMEASFDAMKALSPFIRRWAQAYKVELPLKIKYHPVFHVSLLKLYHGDKVDPRRSISHWTPMGIKV